MEIFRQGDVLIRRVADDQLPANTTPVETDAGRVILAYGEVTGHAHAIKAGPSVQLLAVPGQGPEESKDRWLRIGGDGAELRHEEHATIAIPAGLYLVRLQREYSPQAIRRVAD